MFAETRLRRGAYGQRYDNGQRHDGKATRKLDYPAGELTKGPSTLWDAPGMQRIKIPFGGLNARHILETLADLAEQFEVHPNQIQDWKKRLLANAGQWQEVVARHGRVMSRAQYESTFGLRNEEILPRLFGAAIPRDEGLRMAHEKEARYRELLREGGIGLSPGVADWLRRLRAAGWRQALATSAPRANVDAIFAATGLDRSLDGWVTADDATRGKPDPEVFLAAAARVGVPPARCIVVEDAAAGVEAARRAGMKTIALRATHADLAGDVVVASLADLPGDAFERLLSRG